MITRRNFLTYLAVCPALVRVASALQTSRKMALYANLGNDILHYDMDVPNATLKRGSSITLPACVQYAWPHASRRFLYVISSDYFQDPKTTNHYLSALRIDPLTGELSKHGESVQLPARPIHITTDIPSEHVLVAFSAPSNVRVFRINKDFTLGNELPQPGITDPGVYGHQVRVTPDNRHVILVTRGNGATATKPEEPGALKVFDYNQGILSNEVSVAPNGGLGFGPRNLEFHPTKPWVYVALERQSKLYVFQLEKGKLVGPTHQKDTLAEPNNLRPMQLAGTIRMHPSGRFVYVTNRAGGTVDFDGQKVSAGGENTVAVFSIDQKTGEPTLIQTEDQHKIYARTVDMDPDGQLLVVQNTEPMKVREGNEVRMEPAGLTLSHIDHDGKLKFERAYDSMEYSQDKALWMGIIGL